MIVARSAKDPLVITREELVVDWDGKDATAITAKPL